MLSNKNPKNNNKNKNVKPKKVVVSQPPVSKAPKPVSNPKPKRIYPVRPRGAAMASDAISAIPITVNFSYQSLQCYCLALISRLYGINTEEPDSIYGAYVAMNADFRSIAINGIDFVTSRLRFYNTLMQLIRSKTVRGSGMHLKYNFTGVDLSPPVTSMVSIRGFNYYMYHFHNDNGTTLATQMAPPNVSDDQAKQNYTLNLGLLSNESSRAMMQDQPVAESSTVFSADASAYASRSQYINSTGASMSGGYSSAENEVYAQALPIMSVFAELSTNTDRTAHFLRFASGDSTLAFGLGLFDFFKTLNYSTVRAPIIKYVNFVELWVMYCGWFAGILQHGIVADANLPAVQNYFLAPVPINYAIIAFRQTLLKYFATSQAATQFQSYTYSNGSTFEALRVSSNTASRITTPLVLPAQFCENCRALEAKMYQPQGKNAEKFSQVFLPCLGYLPDTEFINPTISLDGTTYLTCFAPASGPEATANYIDGSNLNTVYDFNSIIINSTISRLNELTSQLSMVSGDVGTIEGSSAFSLLQYTRYDQIGNSDYDVGDYIQTVPQFAQTEMFKSRVRDYNLKKEEFERKQVTRTKSQVKEKFVYKLGAGLESEYARGFSSYTPITNEIKSVLFNMVVPSIVIYNISVQTLITKTGVQSAFQEPNYISVSKDDLLGPVGGGSIETNILNVGRSLAPGLAAKAPNEISRVLAKAQLDGDGGFLDALFGAAKGFLEHI